MKNMSKLKLTVAILALSVSASAVFIGCKKEGVYNPSKKISRIYKQPQGGAKNLDQEWTWDKNLLTKVQGYSGNKPAGDVRYKYEKKRLVKMDWSSGLEAKITYNGNLYNKVEWSYNGRILQSAKFTYDKKKVSKIEVTEFGDDYYSTSHDVMASLSDFLPVEVVRDFERMESEPTQKARQKDGSTSYTVSFKYKKENVSECVYEERGEDWSYKETHTYEKYDNKANPLYKSLELDGDSKNNPLEVTVNVTETDSEPYRYTISYEYTYDGKFPTEVIRISKNNYGQDRSTTYYEYK